MKKIPYALLIAFSAMCLTACNSSSSVNGKFLDKEYILSLEEVKDFYDELEIKGVDKEKITLTSSNKNVLTSSNGEDFKAVSSGRAYIFAKYKNKTVAKAKVNVKYKLSSPSNFNISEDGTLTWDKSYAIIDGEKITAPTYEFEYSQIVDLNEEGEFAKETLTTNSFTFSKKASYKIKITAISDNIYLDNSEEVIDIVHNGVMGVLEEVNFEVNEDYNSQEATITWAEKVNAKYDVYVEGFKIASDIEETKFTFDYSMYAGGKAVQVLVMSKDSESGKLSTPTEIKVNMLESPEFTYSYSKEGKLVWNNDLNATSYKVKFTNYEGESFYRDVTDKAMLQEVLEGYSENIYNVEVIAIGGNTSEGFYVSSKPSTSLRVAKIAKPEVSVEFVDNMANITFEENENVTDYKITWNFKSVYYSTENGLTTSISMSDMPKGGHSMQIIALPKADADSDTGVMEYPYKEDKSNIVVNSDASALNFFVLDDIGEVTHVLQGETSIFTFSSVQNANFYKVYVNDVLVEEANIFEEDGLVTCQITNLNNRAPKDSGYDVKVVAGTIDLVTGKEIAMRSSRVKRLEILDAPVGVENQTNGSFAWQAIDVDCLYSYEIYKTGSDYSLTNNQQPLYSGNIGGLQIGETLTEGYYKIKVKAVSIDRNRYLDSDFNNSNNILNVNFFVTKGIEQPSAEFFVENGKYKLNITTVENASLYEVYVDGTLDGQVASEGLAKEEYIFSSTFEEEGTHEVTIKALAGNRYDSTIYLDSEEFALNVNRLALPEYLVNISYTDFDSANHEWLTIKEIDNSKNVEFLLNGNKATGEDYRLDLADYNTYGTEFKIGLTLKAGDSNGNNYYLDSHLKEIEFVRADYPSQIKYTSGKLTWTQNQEDANKNYISLIVANTASSEYYKRFEIDVTPQEFDLQTYINNLRETDIAFDTAYRQVEKLQVKMLSYMNSESDKYYLPSFYGTTASTGTNTLEINMLESPSLTFDVDSKVISWEYTVEGSKFNIFVDDTLVKSNYDLAKSISLSELGDFDFTNQKKITIQAVNSAYLQSDISSPIYIKELVTPATLNIAKDGNNYRASILINSDSAHVGNVYVNGSADKVTYTEGGNIASFIIEELSSGAEGSITEFAINLIAKNDGSANYYMSSVPVEFSLTDLSEIEFAPELAGESIVWMGIGGDMSGNSINPIRYKLTFTNSGKTFTHTFEDETEVLLTDLEEIAGQELVGKVIVTVEVIVDVDYSLTASGGTPKGYYGGNQGESLETYKLEAVSNAEVAIIEASTYSSKLEKAINSSMRITFADLWTSFEDTEFKVKLDNGENSLDLTLTQEGVTHENYSFTKSGNNYILTLSTIYLKTLPAGNIDLTIQALCAEQISSNVYTLTLNKFDTTSEIEVSETGVLTVKDEQSNASYLVEITIEDAVIEEKLLASEEKKTLDLMIEDILLERKGAYTIKVLTYDENAVIIPATQALTYNGYKLQGIESVSIDDNGNVNLAVYTDDLTNAIFKVRAGGNVKEFLPTLVEDTNSDYYISMLDLFNLFKAELNMTEATYDFEFAMNNAGSIDSDWKKISFNYMIDETPVLTRGRDLDKDYIIFEIGEKSDTVSFSAIVNATYIIEEVDGDGNIAYFSEEREEEIYFKAEDCLGYWVTDLNGKNGYFATEKGSETDLIYKECYAVKVNDILAGLQYGSASITISRIGISSDVYCQYNAKEFELYKLNKINDNAGQDGALKVKDNILSFAWTQKDFKEESANVNPTAYYVVFTNQLGEEVKRITTYTSSLDLRNAGLTAGESYSIAVIAVSSEKDIIASDISGITSTLRYTKPIALQVEDGILTFDKTQFTQSEFMQDIIAYFNQAEGVGNQTYQGLVGNKQYTQPYFFSPSLLDQLYVTLQFTKLDSSGGATNEVYTAKIFGYYLFPDVTIDFTLSDYIEIGKENKASYYSLLDRYMRLNLLNNPAAEAINTATMIQTLNKSPRGIGDNSILIDDIGRTIPAGDYLINVIQTKSNQYVESVSGEAVKMYISPAPEITLQTEEINSRTQYTIDLTPSLTKTNGGSGYQETVGLRYKLSLRPTEKIGTYSLTGNIELIVAYDGSAWSIAYDGNLLEGVISNNEKSLQGVPGFTINMTTLKDAVNTVAAKTIIETNQLMRADVFAYAQDDGYVLNGKSAVFNIKYLDLRASDSEEFDSIVFRNGKFEITSPLDSTYELLVKYKLRSQGENTLTTKFVDHVAELEFDKAGVYEYVVLSLNGSISSNTMNVESASYAITNLYKLNAPTLTTSNSNIIINYTNTDTDYMETIEFNMANNVSLATLEDGYYYTSWITNKSVFAPYIAGSHASELEATEYYAYLNGNGDDNDTFTLSDEGHDKADYLLKFSQEWAVMTSLTSTIKAKMLSPIANTKVDKGHFLIEDNQNVATTLIDSEGNADSANIVYEILVEYYIDDNDNEGLKILQGSYPFYSEREVSEEEAITQLFSGLNFDTDFSQFKVSVTALGAIKATEETLNSIQTVEGNWFVFRDVVYYNEEGVSAENRTQVLRSPTNTTSLYINRTIAPVLAQGSDGVGNGSIDFVIDTSLRNDSAENISIIAETSKGDRVLDGTYNFTTNTSSGEENNVYVTFTPTEGQLNDIVGSFKVRIYIYGEGTIISNPLVISDIYKLANVESKYYNIILEEKTGDTLIDFSEYFKAVAINNDNNCYKLVLNYVLDNGETGTQEIDINDATLIYTIPQNIISLTIQAQDNQSSDASNPKKLIYSDTTTFDIQRTEASTDTLALSWNEQDMRFEWTWTDGREGQYEYHISITIDGKTTTEIVSTNYYLPRNLGTIANGGFVVRARQLGGSNNSFYTFSSGVLYNGNPVEYRLFPSGNGSQSNPYLITTKAHFINMSKRNTSEFYFKLDADLTSTNSNALSISDLYKMVNGQKVFYMDTFNANFDGNGHTIEVVSSETISLESGFTPNLVGKTNLTFAEYSSVFRTLSSSAVVKNIYIDYTINYTTLSNSSIMFSPICAYNYGTIDNVTVSKVNFTALIGTGDSNVAFIGGLASVNYGNITNCTNRAVFDYTMAQQLNLTFGYAGMTLFNANVTTFVGNIENCFNEGNKSVKVTVNNNLVYLAGISLTNSGTISKAGNDGNLTLDASSSVSSMTGYFAGITISSNNGTLEYVYNNATITKNTVYGTFNYGGVVYTVAGGTINNLVVTVSGQPIVKSCNTSPTDLGSNYASSDSGTSTTIATKELSAQTIDCGDGYSIVITQTDSGYTAEIVKNA